MRKQGHRKRRREPQSETQPEIVRLPRPTDFQLKVWGAYRSQGDILDMLKIYGVKGGVSAMRDNATELGFQLTLKDNKEGVPAAFTERS